MALSPDGRTLYIAESDAKTRTFHIHEIELATGERKQIWVSPPQADTRLFPPAMAVSPDGSALAIILLKRPDDGALIRVNTDGSGYREILSSAPLGRDGLAWTPDGRALLFLSPKSVNQPSGQFQLMKVSANGGKAEFTGLITRDCPIAISPDGRTLAFTNGAESQLWSIDNLSAVWRTAR
jgi:sugar lactone lactonase YvrE